MSSARLRRATISSATALTLVLAGLLLVPATASALEISVTSAADSGSGTLRDAVAASSEGDVITFASAVTSIVLQEAIVIPHTLTITGPGAGDLTITHDGSSATLRGLLQFEPSTADQDLTVSGITFVGLYGGDSAIYNSGYPTPGQERARDVNIIDVAATGFGLSGAYVEITSGSVLIENSRFFENGTDTAGGGALFAGIGGGVTLRATEFSENHAIHAGGGLFLAEVAGDVELSEVSFSDNASDGEGGGLALAMAPSTTVLYGVQFLRNTAVDLGGGLVLDETGPVVIDNAVFDGNGVTDGSGGGLAAYELDAELAISASAFRDNFAHSSTDNPLLGSAIAIEETAAPVVISTTTVVGNTLNRESMSGVGGAVVIGDIDAEGSLLIDSSTIADNPIDNAALINGVGLGVLLVAPDATVDVVNSTFREAVGSSSSPGGFAVMGMYLAGSLTVSHSTLEAAVSVMTLALTDPVGSAQGAVSIENSILTRGLVEPDPNVDTPNVSVMFGIYDMSHNIFSGTFDPGMANDEGGNQFRVDPMLGPLQDNGGLTPTMLPLEGSRAINAGAPGIVTPEFDQRGNGFVRVAEGRVDVGAVETQAPVVGPVPNPDPAALPPTGNVGAEWFSAAGLLLLLSGAFAMLVGRRSIRPGSARSR